MEPDILGAAFGLIVGVLLGASHLAASHDPYRNFVTQLIFNWYDAHSRFEGEGLRGMLLILGVVYFLIAALGGTFLVVQLAR